MLSSPGYFVRLSSRSPKDAMGLSELHFLEEAMKQRPSQRTLSGRFGLFRDLLLRGARVTSGEGAMKLLLVSKRVTDDLAQALAAKEEFDEPFDLRLVVRQ